MRLRILVVSDDERILTLETVEGLRARNIAVETLAVASLRDTPSADLLVVSADEQSHPGEFNTSNRFAHTAVVVANPTPSVTRDILRTARACSVIDIAQTSALVVSGLEAAARGLCVIPAGHGSSLAVRLEEAPGDLNAVETEFLGLLLDHTIEGAGAQLGMSRRSAQRFFRSLRRRYNLRDHNHAIQSATAWGLRRTHAAWP